jgi:CheY-like chemotaxis protein
MPITVDDVSAPAKCRTLIVEDDRDSREMMCQLLTMIGHECHAVATVAEALAALTEFQPECLLLDLMLPDGMGTAVLHRIREMNLPIRVAVVTAIYEPENIPIIKRLKPDAIFAKPIDFSALRAWLDGSRPD